MPRAGFEAVERRAAPFNQVKVSEGEAVFFAPSNDTTRNEMKVPCSNVAVRAALADLLVLAMVTGIDPSQPAMVAAVRALASDPQADNAGFGGRRS